MESKSATTPVGGALPDRLFRTLAEATPVGIALYGQGRVLYVNPAVEAMTGYSAQELLAMPPTALVHPEDAEEVERRLAQRLRGERPANERFEVRFQHRDGGARWWEVTASRIEWDGEPAALASIHDVSERRRAEEELRESRERFDLAQSAARYVTWEWNADTDELMVDPRVESVHGVPLSQVGRTGQDFLRLLHPDDRPLLTQVMREARDGRPDRQLAAEVRFRRADGDYGWIGERARLLPAPGKPRRVIGVATDITERKRAEAALSEEKERAQVTLASIGDGVIRTDAAGRIEYMNPMAERLTGWPLEDAAGQPLMDVYRVVDEASRKPLADPLEVCLGQRRVVELGGSSLLLHREGREYDVQDSVAPILGRDGEPTGAVLVFKDVTLVRGMEQEVTYLVTHDPLTGLINRPELERRVERLADRARDGLTRGAFCWVDLAELKLVNESCGHLAGDQLLQLVAERLASVMRAGDTLGRVGGDEFGLLLAGVGEEEARRLAEGVLEAVRVARFHWQDRHFSLGLSIGLVTLGPEGVADPLAAAEAACWLAKEEGRNRVHLHRPDDARLADRYGELHWVQRIHRALEEDLFCLHRQRIEPLSGGQPLTEIFIRMRGEDGHLIAPGEFIPAAERFQLVPLVDRWVVRTAFHRIAGLANGNGGGEHFAINVSGQSLGDESFLADVVAELEASGADPRRLCFEITETAAVTHLPHANRFISVLRGMGCRFVLDDFGSGLSSFAYLKNLQVDYLKVSGDFVRGMAGSEVQWALTRSIHELGRQMGMRTIAEGVESQGDVRAVREIGFDYAQGYWFERPQPL
jgi:PAS domain S-box-containing protein/diguanylate cyclase (GGDEF)-like protein